MHAYGSCRICAIIGIILRTIHMQSTTYPSDDPQVVTLYSVLDVTLMSMFNINILIRPNRSDDGIDDPVYSQSYRLLTALTVDNDGLVEYHRFKKVNKSKVML